MSWQIMDTLNFIGKICNIKRPNGDLEHILIKNILLDKTSHEIKEILYVENRGSGNQCLIKPGKDIIIEPTGETPITRPVDSHLTIEQLAGDDSNG